MSEESEESDPEELSVSDLITFEGEVQEPQDIELARQRKRVLPGDSTVRGWLAGGLAILFGVTALAALGTAIFGSAQQEHQVVDVLRDLLPAELAILGSAVGFYFGGR